MDPAVSAFFSDGKILWIIPGSFLLFDEVGLKPAEDFVILFGDTLRHMDIKTHHKGSWTMCNLVIKMFMKFLKYIRIKTNVLSSKLKYRVILEYFIKYQISLFHNNTFLCSVFYSESSFISFLFIVLHIIPPFQSMYLMANRPWISHRVWLNAEKYPVRKILILWTTMKPKKGLPRKHSE